MQINKLPLKQLFEISQGISLSRYKTELGEITKPIVQIRNLSYPFVESDLEEVRLSVSDVKRYELKKDDIVVAHRGPEMKASVVSEDTVGSLAGQNLLSMRPKPGEGLDSLYVAVILRSQWMDRTLAGLYSTTVGTKMITISDLSNLQFPVPDLKIQRKIAELFLYAEETAKLTLKIIETRKNLIEAILIDMLEEDG